MDEVIAEYQALFGADLITTANTPQGLLIIAETLARVAVIDNNCAIANQINPNIAGGVYLAAIMALTGSAPLAATYSIVSCNLTGVGGTVVPIGSQAQTVSGVVFQSVSAVTLPSTGYVSVNFQAITPGPLAAASGTLTQIITGVVGWEGITNPLDATPGIAAQSDAQARTFRLNTLALQGQSLALAISAGLYNTPGVTSLQYHENVTNSTIVYQTVTLVPHSIYVCVNGGTDLAVATTLLAKKSGGCAWNGGTTVNVTDPSSGQIYPVTFDRPTAVPILAQVTVRQGQFAGNVVASVTQAILDYANGNIAQDPGFVVGQNVSPFELAGAINIEFPSLYVQDLLITLASSVDYQPNEITININQIATIISTSITVIIL